MEFKLKMEPSKSKAKGVHHHHNQRRCTCPVVPIFLKLIMPGELPAKNRGRVDIIRQTAGRGGKTVTVVKNFVGIGLPEKEKLAREMQKACGTGGTVKDGRIEIQGDKRDQIAKILTTAGFRPVFAGG
jgi:translation initiation factor 1